MLKICKLRFNVRIFAVFHNVSFTQGTHKRGKSLGFLFLCGVKNSIFGNEPKGRGLIPLTESLVKFFLTSLTV